MANIIIMGPQGCGKGTHGARISKEYNIPTISTGDCFRKNIAEKTSLGTLAQGFITKGELVPDEITLNMLIERLQEKDCENGYILDGFPRTLNQAILLDKYLEKNNDEIELVLYFDIPEEESRRRISGRITCEDCSKIYNTETYFEEKCQECNGALYVRDDDKPEAIDKRLKTFKEQTLPVKYHYEEKEKQQNRKIVETIDMMGSIAENKVKLDATLEAFNERQALKKTDKNM